MDEEKVLTDSDDILLFEKLRQLRLDLSREEDVPAYVIFHDSTLKEIIGKKDKKIKLTIAKIL